MGREGGHWCRDCKNFGWQNHEGLSKYYQAKNVYLLMTFDIGQAESVQIELETGQKYGAKFRGQQGRLGLERNF